MARFFSPSKRGFFSDLVHRTIPKDAVEISDDEHRALLDAQCAGRVIVLGTDGRPVAADRPVVEPPWDARRRRAYGAFAAQLEMICADLKRAGVDSDFVRHVEAVKLAHPKPSKRRR